MPTYEITSPDGGTYHVDAPEGATEQDALAYVQKNHDKLKALPVDPSKYSQFMKGQGEKDRSIDLSDDPNKEYGNILPYAIDKRTGKAELAFPEFIRSPVQASERLLRRNPGNPVSPQDTSDLINVASTGVGSSVAKLPTNMLKGMVATQPAAADLLKSINAGVDTAAKAKVIAPLMDYVAEKGGSKAPEHPAVQEIMRRLTQDVKGGGPTAQDMLDLQALTPEKPLTLADLAGDNVRGLAGKLARAPGESKAIMSKNMLERDKGASPRVQGDINDALGQKSAYEAKATLDQARSAAAAPLYEEFKAHPPMNPDEMLPEGRIGSLLSRPSMKVGIANAIKIAQEKGVDTHTLGVTLNEAGEPIFLKTPTWETVDFIKAGLDDVVETYRDKTSGKLVLDRYGRAANDTRSDFLRAADSMNPKYKAARDSWAGPSQSRDAIAWGRDFARMEPEEIADRVSRMSPNDKEFARLGVAQTLRKMVMKTGRSGDESRKIAGNEYIQRQLRPFFDDQQAYDKFTRSIDAEGRMFKTNYDVFGNSKTAERAAEDTPRLDVAESGSRALSSLSKLDPIGTARHGLNALSDWRRLSDPSRNAAMAGIISSPLTPESPGMKLLQDFAKMSPQTSNMLNRMSQP